ncbi:MAG: hypothetical protein QCH99_00755 [Candidatus Bathyarchaeota archaeon]|nr:hypothetical protein [Candidatus Bathyarchaeum tardum]WGM89410.1 MAG: hypothetical protein NUK63_10995 [Candidatus Bathyarchaeum tardum]
MKNFLKTKEAISPVTAAIAVITGMVAIAILVAVLMGSIASNQILNKELAVSNVVFTTGDYSSGRIVMNVNNPAASDATIVMIKVNGQDSNSWTAGTSSTIPAGASETFTINQVVSAGTPYTVEMYDTKGTLRASYTGTA